MPKAIDADWPLIQTLYAQGVSPKSIEAKTGVKAMTISQRASRKGWTKALTRANMESAKSALNSIGEQVRGKLADDIRASLDMLPRQSKTTQGFHNRHAAIGQLVTNARTVFGWNDATSNPAVRINVLASAVRIEEGNPSNPQSILIPSAPQGEGEEGTP